MAIFHWDVWNQMNHIWLVVWNMAFIFPYIGNNHPNWLSYFSEGLKPPTSVAELPRFTRRALGPCSARYEKAHRVAKAHLSPAEKTELYVQLAQAGGCSGRNPRLGKIDILIWMYKMRIYHDIMYIWIWYGYQCGFCIIIIYIHANMYIYIYILYLTFEYIWWI